MSKIDRMLHDIKYRDDPPFTHAECSECDWTGKPSDCETGWESDENPEYPVAYCPKCGESSVVFYRIDK